MALSFEELQKLRTPSGPQPTTPVAEPVRTTPALERINSMRSYAKKSTIPTREATFLEKTGDVAGAVGKGIADVFTEGTRKFGESIGTAIKMNLPSVQAQQEKTMEAAAQESKVFGQLVAKRNQMLKEGKDVTEINKAIKSVTKGPKFEAEDVVPKEAMKTAGQIYGEAGRMVLEMTAFSSATKGAQSFKMLPELSAADKILKAKEALKAKEIYDALTTTQKAGQILKQTGKALLTSVPQGYGYDVTGKLMQGETGKEAFTPGLGTAISAAVPVAIGTFKLAGLARKPIASAIESKLIKPYVADVRFGKDPAGAAVEFIKPANNWDDYVKNAYTARKQVGQEITDLANAAGLGSKVKVTITNKDLKELDNLINIAAKTNDETLLKRAIAGRDALTKMMVAETDELGGYTGKLISKGPAKLQDMTIPEVLEFKRTIGDMTSKWTGNPSVDKPFDRAIKRIYSTIKTKLDDAVALEDPGIAKRFSALNDKYGSLNTAVIAIQRQADKAATGGMPFGEAMRALGAAGAGAAATGPVGLLAGVGLYAVEEASKNPAVMSRLAKAVYGGGPGLVEKIYQNNPRLANALYNLFVKENASIDDGLRRAAKETFENVMNNPKGGFIKFGEEIAPKITPSITSIPIKASEKYEGLLRSYKYALGEDVKKVGEQLIKETETNPAAKKIAEMSRESLKGVDFLYRYGDENGISYSLKPQDYFEKKDGNLIKIPVTPEVLNRVVYADNIADRLSEIPGFTSTYREGKIISSLPNSGEGEVILKPIKAVIKDFTSSLPKIEKQLKDFVTQEQYDFAGQLKSIRDKIKQGKELSEDEIRILSGYGIKS